MAIDTSENSHTITQECINRGESLFITGKAGTGKTTLLKWLYNKFCDRRIIAIVAPTGVAAKQAGGVTIHSLLRLPLKPYMPGMKIPNLYAVSKDEEIRAIREIDILIIDEVSMVRCDVMDAMDDILRHYRKNNEPFGGIQVVLFGDLYQLMPVIKDEEWDELKKHYASPYFFSSDVYAKLNCQVLELAKIYRQHDSDFITLLNHVRDGKLYPMDKKDLESRYVKNFDPDDSEGYIRLTTHNWKAKRFNQQKLESLTGKLFEYKAYIEGFFPMPEFPTNYVLQLKKGARVMFVRNENNAKKFVNGTLGTVIDLGDSFVEVLTDENVFVKVARQTWDFERYKFNKEKKELEVEHCGSFTQYPLRLAWCVTVHKSQGLTFNKVIIDAERAFTYGQVYVALSRCRHFYGIVLVSEIKEKNIKADPIVEKFLKETEKIVVDKPDEDAKPANPTVGMSENLRRTYWAVMEGLDAAQIIRRSDESKEIVYSHLAKLIEQGLADVKKLLPYKTIQDIRSVAARLGKDASLRDIKLKLQTDYPYGEINMVKASLTDQDYIATPYIMSEVKPAVTNPPKVPEQRKIEPIVQRSVVKPQPAMPVTPHRPKFEHEVVQHKSSREHKRWTTREEERLKLYFQKGKSFAWLANEIGRTKAEITSKLIKLGLIKWDGEAGEYVKL